MLTANVDLQFHFYYFLDRAKIVKHFRFALFIFLLIRVDIRNIGGGMLTAYRRLKGILKIERILLMG